MTLKEGIFADLNAAQGWSFSAQLPPAAFLCALRVLRG